MKKVILVICTVAVILFSFCFVKRGENQENNNDNENIVSGEIISSSNEESGDKENDNKKDLYGIVTDAFSKVDFGNYELLNQDVLEEGENWNTRIVDGIPFSYMWWGATANREDVAIAVEDLNDDGRDEIILCNLQDAFVNESMMWDVFTIVDNKIVNVISSSERDSFSLCEGNLIRERGSSSASESFIKYYKMNVNGELELVESLEMSPEGNVWTDGENSGYLSSEEAEAFFEKYEVKKLEKVKFEK